ncbi:dienelactone hydrolase family protein [Aureliella helgolandensis]|uniref:Alpha/beta hydrolase family protein n=1 Tax=Aureliella helgolandensis TaxID=2527968 RepID=A0A518GAV8_9BACT|nr:dienelactone hydrolase family protein [Aureliella helgolandensis]QDV25709.1 Alpha/beta hydrolase family protein [Aureliella helgolandensis]
MTFSTRMALAILIPAFLCNSIPAHDFSLSELPGTEPLRIKGDIAAQMVDGIDGFLLRSLEDSVANRESFYHRDLTSPDAYSQSLSPNRQQLARIIGASDVRHAFTELEFVADTATSQVVEENDRYKIYAVRWPVVRNVHGEGLWLVPHQPAIARVIAVPDADQTPEMIVGVAEGQTPAFQYARQLVENGCEVLVPTVISREYKSRNGRAKMTNREYLYRSSFVLGRHIIGHEVQKILAAVDWFSLGEGKPIGVVGYGEGGLLSMYSAALDTRIEAACIGGYFGSRQRMWEQPISRNVFGLLEAFGDGELGAMIMPRSLTIDGTGGPELQLPGEGGAPALLTAPGDREVATEIERLRELIQPFPARVQHVRPDGGSLSSSIDPRATAQFWSELTGRPLAEFQVAESVSPVAEVDRSAERHQRQFTELEQHNQWLLQQSEAERRAFLNLGSHLPDTQPGRFPVDTSSLESYERSMEPYREYFREEVIGHFKQPLLEFNARSRKVYDEPKWAGYEVVLDVFPGVFTSGILCLPKDLRAGERRPVVVCQHGLEGRPEDIVTGDHRAYHDFAAKLAERGYVTFAPQNPYIGQDRFRTLQRKANPLKKTLFSIIVPQHQQIVNWLKSQPFVEGEKIAFYGLSYGGKSAMRIPPLVPDYCLSICSADFNEWVDKNSTTQADYSYVWTPEYEIFEFDLGGTFNYAEMAALIAPRPFMVERGHFDGVGTDENVAHEFAKVRFLYAARLGIADRCAIEWFVGPHTINGKGTFEFLDRHLKSK